MTRIAQTLLAIAALLVALGVLWISATDAGGVRFVCNGTTGVYSTAHSLTVQGYDPACVNPDTGMPNP